MVREIFSNKRYSEKWFTLESKSKRESLEMLTSFNPDYSTQDSFIVNSCDIGIEELQNDTHTEYKATVRNCQDSEAISKYFMAYVRGQSGNVFQLTHSEFSPPENESVKIIRYYQSDERDIYYAVLNHPVMEAEGVTLQSLWFVFYVQDRYINGRAPIARYLWHYDILLH